ncbi:MAG: ubiquinone/menaquinone biosynthesis C-methylase UbiE [Haloarculaceae archaeon]
MRYYFGLYHWRRRFRRLLGGVAGIVTGVLIWRHTRSRLLHLGALGLVVAGANRARRPLQSLFDPPPWVVRTTKYADLAASLPVPEEGRVLDIGCGTGRSLVGLADDLPPEAEVVGLDVFDDRVILGNGPRLAARNARVAGLDPAVVEGDAARLPVADDSMDVVTACRVLHDLPKADAETALAECHRVLRPDGRLGVLELPIPHDADADPDDYWRALLSAAGFTIESAGTAGVDTVGYNFVSNFAPRAERNCSRDYSRQYDDRYFRYTAIPDREREPPSETSVQSAD